MRSGKGPSPLIKNKSVCFDEGKDSRSTPSGGMLMTARGIMRTPCALMLIAVFFMAATQAGAWGESTSILSKSGLRIGFPTEFLTWKQREPVLEE